MGIFWHILGVSWAYLGHVLGIFWAYFGHILGIYWACIEHILGICWACIEHILHISIFQAGALFCTETATFKPIFANFGYFVANLSTFWCPFTGLNNAVMSHTNIRYG